MHVKYFLNYNFFEKVISVELTIRGEDICLSDSNRIRTYNHLVRKRTLNHLSKPAKLLLLLLLLPTFIRVPFINTMVLLPINLKKYK